MQSSLENYYIVVSIVYYNYINQNVYTNEMLYPSQKNKLHPN